MEDRCMEHNVLESILDGSMEPRDLPFPLLEKITENFSKDRIIGDGGFAVVYKGVLQNVEVAVKRIMNNMTINETLFRREVDSLTQVNHQNIVRFLGFCSNRTHKQLNYEGQYIYAEKRERLLCFEYINNGSLEKYITDELRGLKWNTRYNIIKGICKGLEYLHIDRHFIHMNLKPANILLDNDMMAKITDFGLSRMDENSRTIGGTRFFSLGYCAPEYLLHGKISPKCDVYSLGAIIMEVVTGHRVIAPKNNVLRKWCHRWKKTGQETPFAYLQVAKLIEIGYLCMENDPYKRPSISAIINELESIGQEDDMLAIEPLELHFPFVLNKQTSRSLKLTNDTDAYIAFSIQTTSLLPYCIEPAKGIVTPRSNYTVNITLQPLNKVPQDKRYTGDFVVWSIKLNESLTSENINQDMFKEHESKVVDVVNLTVAHEPCEPHSDLPSGIGNLNSPEASNLPEKAESKYSDDEESALPSEITTSTLLSSLEMKDQATELKILEDILIDAYINPAGLSYPFFKSITRNFSEEIGCGGFGVVYLGHLRTGKVAVKKLFTSQRISEKLFLDEINCLMKTKHSNIVRFLGYCADTQGKCVPLNQRHVIAEAPQRLLCFEYVPNGNLQEYLKDKSHKDEWKIRYRMIKGICHGLNYLHEQRIIHLDLKPDNILLDACMIPKITDFGISRCFDEGISKVFTKIVRGTPGSIAPEIIDSGEITFKADIYGLGIIIIKLLTGSNKYDFENWRTSIDVDGPQVKSCIDMAQRCVAFNQHERPAMGKIMQKLDEIDRL